LEGFDDDWSALTTTHTAQYGNLPAGNYTFKVKAMGGSGVWSKPIEFTFTVLPPWWNNLWSYILYALLGLICIILIFRWRVSSLKTSQKRLEKKIEQATQVILNQKTEVEKQKDLAEAQKIEAEEQRRIAQEQKLLVEEQNKEILDSIEYAKRIQTAILPPSKTVIELLKDSFVIYLPKDIVAGDFYWMDELGESIYFAACDCTGHGVPGAMVSVVCNYVLNASVNEFSLRSPGAIFDKSRELLVENFAKSDEDVKDGMDASLCALNFKTRKLQWSGANNPLWIYRTATSSIEEIKPDKQPIGKGYELKPFTTHDIDLNSGDIIYVFTDGFADQFGGERNKKLTRSKFRELLLTLAQLPMDQQRHQLLDFHNQYRGTQEQVDDICIIGVRV
jgi:serine phosphatase RsbU (regulator of sigma subunit)